MNGMTAHELQAWLRSQFPKEDERNEWKEWRSLKHHVSGQQGDDVISYVAAISNMEGGALVLGVEDKTLKVIYEMFSKQRRRFLPLPDYEQSDASHVVLKIYGQAIDENYSQLLMERSDLPLEQVLWLDRVQKKQKVDAAHIAELRKAGLIEGRKPHWTVSANIAAAANSQNE